MADKDSTRHLRRALGATLRVGIAAFALNIFTISGSEATVLDSYISMPGVKGDAKIPAYQKWIRFNASYWKRPPVMGFGGRGGSRRVFSGPAAPLKGEGTLVVALDKKSHALARLMDMCARKAAIKALSYAENSELNRGATEIGPRPESVPEYFEYRLQDVTVSSCPVLADAPEQAFVLTFKNVQWLNYQPPAAALTVAGASMAAGAAAARPAGAARGGATPGTATPVTLTPAALRPAQTSGKTRTYVVEWYGYANDISEDQCPKMFEKPSVEDYFKYFTPAAMALEKARLAPGGGVPQDLCFRGPEQLDLCRLPGVVPDPMQPEPQTMVARGLNLDGNDGSGAPPSGIRKHKNFVSADGRTGIDNQLYVATGCMRGLKGHLGQSMQYANEQRKNGALTIMLQITGIDDARNDDSIDVTLFYSMDKVAKSGDGNAILADYTFRVTDDLDFSHSFKRWHGRIVNGVVVTDPDLEPLKTNLNQDLNITLYNSALRLEFKPDRSLKGVLAGYQDWRKIVNAQGASLQESLFGSSVPAMYNAMKRNADGLRDPVTGEFNGISSAWDVEAIPAYVIPDARKSVLASVETQERQAR